MLQAQHARQGLNLAAALLLVLSFVPLRWSGWMMSVGRLTQFFAAPISQPFAAVSRWAAPATRDRDDELVSLLRTELEAARSLMLRHENENKRLRDQIRELQHGIELNPGLPVRQVMAPVYGTSADLSSGLLRVRAGTAQDVDENAVATTSGLQLVGRVVSAGARTSSILPITSPKAGPLRAMVMIDATANGLVCTLTPQGDGTLRGPVEDRRDPATAQAIQPQVGQQVRLSDPDRWPAHSQMLLVGEVIRVEPAPDQPLRAVVVVAPMVERLDRVSEVVLRVSPMPDAEPAGRRPGR